MSTGPGKLLAANRGHSPLVTFNYQLIGRSNASNKTSLSFSNMAGKIMLPSFMVEL